jgi:His-Xaa-Ser system protein HxsD
MVIMKDSLSEKRLVLDDGIYSAAAVRLAAFVFSGKAEIQIRPGGGASVVTLRAKRADLLAGEFLNEALNQQCRLDLAGKNSSIAGIIVTRALLSAAGDTEVKAGS